MVVKTQTQRLREAASAVGAATRRNAPQEERDEKRRDFFAAQAAVAVERSAEASPLPFTISQIAGVLIPFRREGEPLTPTEQKRLADILGGAR